MSSGPGAPEGRGSRAGTALRLILSAFLFAVGLLVLFIENAGRLGEFAPTFAQALNAVDPFYLLRQQWFRIWCALGVRGVCTSLAPAREFSAPPLLSAVLAAVALTLFLTGAGLWESNYHRRTKSYVAISENWFLPIIVVGTSVTLWVLKITLLGLVSFLGWAAGFRIWGSMVSLAGGSMALLHLHNLYKEGRDVAEAVRALSRR